MLHQSTVSLKIHSGAKTLVAASAIGVTVVTGLSKLPVSAEYGPVYTWIQLRAEEGCWWLVLGFVLLGSVASLAQRLIGSPPVWEIMYALIDDLRDEVFTTERYGDDPPYHRVTLFRIRSYRNKWDLIGLARAAMRRKPNLLVPIIRSSHTGQDTDCCFKVGDREGQCEGIAGRAWYRNRIVSVGHLPDLSRNCTEEHIRDYSDRTNVSSERTRHKRPLARSLYAIPVTSSGSPWGVLVFDSRSPEKIDHGEVTRVCRIVTRHLSKITEKIL
jgi:hypothetical protein